MRTGKYEKPAPKAPGWHSLLTIVLLLIFVGSCCHIAGYAVRSHREQQRYEELAAMVENRAPAQSPTDASPALPPEPENAEMLPGYAALYDMNPDFVGWIEIEGTRIHYPVMQTPDEPDHYLYRNFDGQYTAQGSIYAREQCDLSAPSDNVILYGHHMRDGSMFQNLTGYTAPAYWEQHRHIRFDTLTERHTYEIFAVFTTTATVGEGFNYIDFVNAGSPEEFDAYVQTCIALSLYDTGIVPQYGDKLLTLSTCEYSQTNGRLVVVAVRIE